MHSILDGFSEIKLTFMATTGRRNRKRRFPDSRAILSGLVLLDPRQSSVEIVEYWEATGVKFPLGRILNLIITPNYARVKVGNGEVGTVSGCL